MQLEEQILFGRGSSADAPPAKRQAVGGGRGGVNPVLRGDTAEWAALADVYGQLGLDELVHVVYANRISR